MLERQKVLLRLVHELGEKGKHPSKTYLDKLLFVLQKESPIEEKVKFYHFYPHHYGPFSNLFYLDLADLESRGYLNGKYELSGEGRKIALGIDKNVAEMIKNALEMFGSKEAAIKHVYANYPQYTSKSRLKETPRKDGKPGICSIGYEKKDIDLFLDLLIQNDVETLVDVRRNPFSMSSAYIGSRLESTLKNAGIAYLHVPELGIDGEYRKNLESDKDYEELFSLYRREMLPKNDEKARMVAKLGKEKKIALMCFEADKCHCHRGVLAEKLEEWGMKVEHL